MANLFTILPDHVSLTNTCIDRLYINGYLPSLQTSGQLCYYLGEHLGNPIPSPALLTPLRDRFRRDLASFTKSGDIPVVPFERKRKDGKRKDDVAAEYRSRFREPEGVVFVGVAQERASSFKADKRSGPQGGIWFDFSRQPVYVNHYYFYVQDPEWGPAFLKIGSYVPYPVKLCLNGHEWAKQQLRREGIGFEALDNGFRWCEQPERLQQICDQLGPDEVQGFYDRWSRKLPWPLTERDRRAGFEHRLTVWQLEVSVTQVFDRPVQGRHFFEQVIRDNLDLGRPDRVSLLFPQRHTRRTRAPRRGYRTRVITQGVNPSLHIEYKKSQVKQYFKEERALRTETTINDPGDFQVNKGLENLPHLVNLGRQIDRKLLEVERVSHHCLLSEASLDRIQQPTVEQGHRASALRFADRRVMALLQALCMFFHLPHGFRNRDLRRQVAGLLGLSLEEFTRGKMTYDLRRLRLKGIIYRIPKTHRYVVTTHGLRAAFLFSKVYLRILRPASQALTETSDEMPIPLRRAFQCVEAEIGRLCQDAQLSPAAV
jgi:hypothetical protein